MTRRKRLAERNDAAAALLDLASSDPREALKLADQTLMSEGATPADRLAAEWARGLAQRQLGRFSEASDAFSAAIQLAHETGFLVDVPDIEVGLALVRFNTGDTAQALKLLDGAVEQLAPDRATRAEIQTSLVLQRLGRLDEAALIGARAQLRARRQGESELLVHVCINLGLLHGQRGDVVEGQAVLREAIELADELGMAMPAVIARHNLAYLQAQSGSWAVALAGFEASITDYLLLGNEAYASLARADQAAVLLDANLLAEAVEVAESAVAGVRLGGNMTDLADTFVLLARCRFAAGDHDGAANSAAEAIALFREQRRPEWVPIAEHIRLRAADHVDARGERFEQLVAELKSAGWKGEAVAASVSAAFAYLDGGDHESALRVLATTDTRTGSALVRVSRHHAAALLAESAGRPATARRSVTRGLREMRDCLALFGTLELRARAVTHAEGLVAVGTRLALHDHRPRELLVRLEEVRRLSSVPVGSSAPSSETEGLLGDLRAVQLAQRDPAQTVQTADRLHRRHRALEQRLRSLSRSTQDSMVPESLTILSDLRSLGDVVLMEFVESGMDLFLVTAIGGRCRLHHAGAVGDVKRLLEGIAFAIERLQRSNVSPAARAAAMAALDDHANELDRQLVPGVVRRRQGAPAVIVTSRSLAGVPWRVLPAFHDTSIAVSSSLGAWMTSSNGRSRTAAPTTLLIAGPELTGASREVEQVSLVAHRPSVFDAQSSSVSDVVRGLRDVDIAHFACHGRYRADSPLFSSLRLADGDLTFYDLEQCERLPQTIVLSACNAGQNAVLDGGALLGMASALIQLGVSSVIAPLTSVNDERSVDLMVRLHTHLAAGWEPAEALAAASTGADGRLDPTAAPFICFGS